jgi:hypothetical protein
MYLRTFALIAVSACQTQGSESMVPVAGPPPTFEVDPPILGEDWNLRVVGAPPGASVTFAASRTGSGGTCPPGAAPCWGLEGPFILGVASADPSGLAALTVRPARTFPFPTVGFQAWVNDGVAPILLPPIDETLSDTWADVRGEFEGICAVNTLGEGTCSDDDGDPLPIPPGPWQKLFNVSGGTIPGWTICGLRDNGQIECPTGRSGTTPPPAGTFIDLDADRSAACALDVAGALSCWAPTTGWTLTDPGPYTDVDMGWWVCALSAAGDLWCDGHTGWSLELTGPFTRIANSPDLTCGFDAAGVATCVDRGGTPVSIPGNWLSYQSYNGIDCGLRTDGTISCAAPGSPPTVLAAPTTGGWVELQVGNRGACALNADGFATCWGGDTASSTWLPPGWPTQTIVSICGTGVNVNGPAEDPHHSRNFTFTLGSTVRMVRRTSRMNDRFTFAPRSPGCPDLLSGSFGDSDGFSWEIYPFRRGWVAFEAFGPTKVAFRLHGDVAMGIDKRP